MKRSTCTCSITSHTPIPETPIQNPERTLVSWFGPTAPYAVQWDGISRTPSIALCSSTVRKTCPPSRSGPGGHVNCRDNANSHLQDRILYTSGAGLRIAHHA